MFKRSGLLACASTLILAATAFSQPPAGPPKPGPEHKKLDYFAGKWTFEGEMKPSPMGPGGKMTGSDTCEWFAGGFHLTCRSDGKGPMGEMKGLGFLGYSADDKAYTYSGINNIGDSDSAKATLTGDTWSWTGESKMGGKPVKGNYIIKQLSPDSYSFHYEMSVDGAPFATVMEGKYNRVK